MIELSKIKKNIKDFLAAEGTDIKESNIAVHCERKKDSKGAIVENYVVSFSRRVADVMPLWLIKQGTVVKISGIDFIVLLHCDGNTVLITKDIPFKGSFGKSSNPTDCNVSELCESSLFFAGFIEENKDHIRAAFASDLAEDGTENDKEGVFKNFNLLTLTDYRLYRKYLEPLGTQWWLGTPATYTLEFGNYVLTVDADGVVGTEEYNYKNIGFRPVCILNSAVMAEIVK